MDFIHFGRQAVVGLIREGGSNDLRYARAPGRVYEEARVNAISSDDPERVWSFHEARLTM
jgi:hypothetical protein